MITRLTDDLCGFERVDLDLYYLMRHVDGAVCWFDRGCVANSRCGHRVLFSLWDGYRELPERLHHADSGTSVDCCSALAVPALRDADQGV